MAQPYIASRGGDDEEPGVADRQRAVIGKAACGLHLEPSDAVQRHNVAPMDRKCVGGVGLYPEQAAIEFLDLARDAVANSQHDDIGFVGGRGGEAGENQQGHRDQRVFMQ